MKVGIIRTRIDLKTKNRISEEIIEVKEMDEDEYYGPIVRILGNDFLKRFKAGEYDKYKEDIK